MELFGVLFFFLFLLLPVWLAIMEYRARVSDRYWRTVGIVILRNDALDSVADIIGHYMGRDIYRSVTFKGLCYEFDCVVLPAYKARMRERELYLDPGLLYVAR